MTSSDARVVGPDEGSGRPRPSQRGARETLSSPRSYDGAENSPPPCRSTAAALPWATTIGGSVRRSDEVGTKIGRKMRVESFRRIFIRRAAAEADETGWANKNNAAFRQPRPDGIEPCLAAIDDRDEGGPARNERVELRRVAKN